MKEIGIRELKAKASSLVRQVAESGATYAITRHGRPVGQLAPSTYAPPPTQAAHAQAWSRVRGTLHAIGTEKKARHPSALSELAKMRR